MLVSGCGFGGLASGIAVRAIQIWPSGSSKPYLDRSEEHTSELQSLMRISYAVFCLKKKNSPPTSTTPTQRANRENIDSGQTHLPSSSSHTLAYRRTCSS